MSADSGAEVNAESRNFARIPRFATLAALPLALLLCALLARQDGLGRAETRALERFSDLPAEEQERVAEAAFEAALAAEHPVARAVAALREHPRVRQAPLLPPEPARAFDPEEFAPALQLKTKVFEADSAAWKSVHRRLLGGRIPPPWPAGRMRWDPGRDALLLPAAPPPPEATLRALLAGAWPPDDRVGCWALAALDDDPSRDAAADYFEHAYRNRGGGVYAGIRLADVWDCGREFEVSDVEAIAWLRRVGGGTDLVSPIPGSEHRKIYGRIEESFVSWRAYWSLREALAQRMAQPWAEADPQWRGAQQALDRAWILCDHDPERMAARLRLHPERPAFLGAANAEYETEPEDVDEKIARSVAGDARLTLADEIRAAALATLRAEGLLGLGAR